MKRIGLLLLCCCLVLSVAALAEEAAKPDINENGMPLMPDFTLTSASGEEITLSDFEGRQIVLYFWATWCPTCVQGMPDKQALHDWMLENDFPGEVWAVNLTDGIRETRNTCDAFLERNGYTMPVLYDEGGKVFQYAQSRYIPVTMVIDEAGYQKSWVIGAQPMEEIIAILLEEEDT